MNGFYDEMRGIATTLLTEFDQKKPGAVSPDPGGNGIYYIHSTPGTGPADNPGPSTETPYKLNGAARGVRFKYVDNTDIITSDMQITVAVRDDVTPNMKGFIVADGVRFKIVAVKPIPPVGVTVANVIIFRK